MIKPEILLPIKPAKSSKGHLKATRNSTQTEYTYTHVQTTSHTARTHLQQIHIYFVKLINANKPPFYTCIEFPHRPCLPFTFTFVCMWSHICFGWWITQRSNTKYKLNMIFKLFLKQKRKKKLNNVLDFTE